MLPWRLSGLLSWRLSVPLSGSEFSFSWPVTLFIPTTPAIQTRCLQYKLDACHTKEMLAIQTREMPYKLDRCHTN